MSDVFSFSLPPRLTRHVTHSHTFPLSSPSTPIPPPPHAHTLTRAAPDPRGEGPREWIEMKKRILSQSIEHGGHNVQWLMGDKVGTAGPEGVLRDHRGCKYGKRGGEWRENTFLEGPGRVWSLFVWVISRPNTHLSLCFSLSVAVSCVYSLIFSTRQPLTLDGWG